MACDRDTQILISCYADGESSAEESAYAKIHLQSCSECRNLVEKWQSQRQLLEWAYTSGLSEEKPLNLPSQHPEDRPVIAGVRWPGLLSRRVWAVAAAVVACAIVCHLATKDRTLGRSLATNAIGKSVRVSTGISLKLGPYTRIKRIDNRSIAIDGGWVEADVRHGTGFRVVAKRVEVIDRGTRFSVTTGSKADIVAVQEGSVVVLRRQSRRQVNVGQVLIAKDAGEPSIGAFPTMPSSPEDAGLPLSHRSSFRPEDSDSLDWTDSMMRLSKRFPNARHNEQRFIHTQDWHGLSIRIGASDAPGLRSALREHFAEISQLLAGAPMANRWEIPVGFVLVDGIDAPHQLPADIYYIRLVAGDGRLVWRLTGSSGNHADFPVGLEGPDPNNRGIGNLDRIEFQCDRDRFQKQTMRLNYWPGEIKPVLRFVLRGSPTVVVFPADRALYSELVTSTADVVGFKPRTGKPTVLYLDQEREHRIMLVWNDDGGAEMLRVVHSAKGGSALLAAVATDVPWQNPVATESVNLLWWVLPGAGEHPHLEMTAHDWRYRRILPGPPTENSDSSGFNGTWGLGTLPDGRDIFVDFAAMPAGKSSFPFRFMVRRGQSEHAAWGEGWISIRKP